MMIDRRTFLAGTPLIFGLPSLFAQDDKKPDWLAAALKRMKQTRRCGLVLVAPAADEARVEMGERLLALVEGKDADVRALCAECVVVCQRRDLARKTVGDLDEKENAVVLDADGKRLVAGTITAEAMAKPADVVAVARFLLHGKDGARLKAAVESARAALPGGDRDAITRAIDLIDSEGEPPAAATGTLKAHAEKIAPWLAFATLDAVYKPARERYRAVLLELADRAAADPRSGLRLPYGVKLAGSAKPSPKDDPCPACGMAIVEEASKRFLDFLAE